MYNHIQDIVKKHQPVNFERDILIRFIIKKLTFVDG